MENINNKSLVKIKNLEKKYLLTKFRRGAPNFDDDKKHFYALRDFNSSVYKLDRIAIVGHNGSGKSTLVNIIAQVLKPTKGKVEYFFEKGDVAHNVGIQFQENVYPASLTVGDLIKFYKQIYSHKINSTEFDVMAKKFNLNVISKKFINRLSGGQKQRINIFLALVHRPKLLILDEVSTGLDITLQDEICSFIDEVINEYNLTLLIVSHNLFEIEKLATRVWFVNNGNLMLDLSVNDIKANYKDMQNFLQAGLNQIKERKS